MHHKLRLRDDSRVDSLVFFEEHLTMVAHLKQTKKQKEAAQGGKGQSNEEKLDKFKKAKNLQDIQLEFDPEEYLVLRIFDKIKVKVDTTTEFPLDIQCTLMITDEDEQEYNKLFKEAEEKAAAKLADSLKNIGV